MIDSTIAGVEQFVSPRRHPILEAVESYAPRNFNVARAVSNIVIPGDLRVYGFVVYSTNAAAQYLTVFDASALPSNGAVPAFAWPLAAHNGVGLGFTWAGRHFSNGLVLCNSSTDSTLTIGSADCFFDVQYDVVIPQLAND